MARYERYPTKGGACIRKCKRGKQRNAAGTCGTPNACDDQCAENAATATHGYMQTIKELFGYLHWMLVVITIGIWLFFLIWLFRVKEQNDDDELPAK